VHPALLDAALHAVGFITGGGWRPGPAGDGEGGGLVPFAWGGVRVAGRGVRVLRVRLRPAGDGAVTVLAADPDGELVVSVDELVMRPVSAGGVAGGAGGAGRFAVMVEWVPAAGIAAAAAGGRCWAGMTAAAAGLAAAGVAVSGHAGLDALAQAAAAGSRSRRWWWRGCLPWPRRGRRRGGGGAGGRGGCRGGRRGWLPGRCAGRCMRAGAGAGVAGREVFARSVLWW